MDALRAINANGNVILGQAVLADTHLTPLKEHNDAAS
jgi:hypothetical protein